VSLESYSRVKNNEMVSGVEYVSHAKPKILDRGGVGTQYSQSPSYLLGIRSMIVSHLLEVVVILTHCDS
jgi:hypothetical protein